MTNNYKFIFSKNDFSNEPKIKIVGVGGGGGNAVNRMIKAQLKGADFITINTDAQVLRESLAEMKMQIGRKLKNGLGTGGIPALGKQSAEEDIELIREVLRGSNMVFITAGMGGGTGTGAAPVIAEIAREVSDLVVAIVTKPFQFEGAQRNRNAEEGIRELKTKVDTMIVIPNQSIFKIIDSTTTAAEAYIKVDEVLKNAISAISDIITTRGLINVDFNDVKTIMKNAGEAIMCSGESLDDEPDRAKKAVEHAIRYPLLDELSIESAKGILVNISGGDNLRMIEISEIMESIKAKVAPDANILYGNVIDQKINNIKVTVIATGFSKKDISRTFPNDLTMFPTDQWTENNACDLDYIPKIVYRKSRL